jgi:GxxExxY protein
MDGSAGDRLLYRDETFRIRSAIFAVHSGMGPGFLEAVYQECLRLEFAKQGIAFEALKPLRLDYRGEPLRQSYVADFICYGRIIIELKAVRALAPEHRAQTMNYLRAAKMRVGLLVNFGGMSAEIERFAL